MYGLPDRLRPLSAAEEQVMLAVWACREPATRRDLDESRAGAGQRERLRAERIGTGHEGAGGKAPGGRGI